ncbi:hypothetical protein C8T65DRAFT_697054 [Cerioporus squamosus]|nr:hypothetical protein C8T65DRAFT_697054 [Cerioporus squamosus]
MPNPPTYNTLLKLPVRRPSHAPFPVEEQIAEDGLQVSRGCRSRVQTAVTNIARSHRLRLQRDGDETLVCITAEGLQEFAAYGTIPIHPAGSPRLKRMSRDEASTYLVIQWSFMSYTDLEREVEVLNDIAQKIQQAVREVKPGSPAADDPAVAVDEVRNAIDHSKALDEQTTALYTAMGENSKRERYLKGLLKEGDAHTAGGDQAGPSRSAV